MQMRNAADLLNILKSNGGIIVVIFHIVIVAVSFSLVFVVFRVLILAAPLSLPIISFMKISVFSVVVTHCFKPIRTNDIVTV